MRPKNGQRAFTSLAVPMTDSVREDVSRTCHALEYPVVLWSTLRYSAATASASCENPRASTARERRREPKRRVRGASRERSVHRGDGRSKRVTAQDRTSLNSTRLSPHAGRAPAASSSPGVLYRRGGEPAVRVHPASPGCTPAPPLLSRRVLDREQRRPLHCSCSHLADEIQLVWHYRKMSPISTALPS